MATIRSSFNKAKDNFVNSLGNDYGACIYDCFYGAQLIYIEWRMHRPTNKLHIIQYDNNGSYEIFLKIA